MGSTAMDTKTKDAGKKSTRKRRTLRLNMPVSPNGVVFIDECLIYTFSQSQCSTGDVGGASTSISIPYKFSPPVFRQAPAVIG